jgi:lambda repressor-like predicted transcriptional regulator
MPIKRHTMSKSKKSMKSKKSKRNSRMNKKTMKNMKNKKYQKQKGGFGSDCNLATVKEPGFSIDALGSIAGLSIPGSRAAIHRPNCKTDRYQAMIP